jgi:type IV secretory pathway TrbD component
MSNDVITHRVFRAINRPLTIWGVERRLFFLVVFIGAATFNFFASLSGGLVMFAGLYIFAHWTTATDPQILRILLNSSRFKKRYDPAKPAGSLFRGVYD